MRTWGRRERGGGSGGRRKCAPPPGCGEDVFTPVDVGVAYGGDLQRESAYK